VTRKRTDAVAAPLYAFSVDQRALKAGRWAKASTRGVVRQWKVMRQIPLRRRSPRHLIYIAQQLDKSTRYAAARSSRTERLVAKAIDAARATGSSVAGAKVLCVGCRNSAELDLFQAAGCTPVGVDLFSNDPRVRQMDMHDLQFDAHSFDLIYACHALEHAIEPSAVAGELTRVAREGAVCTIEVPIKFRTSLTDRQDYGSVGGVLELFGDHVGDVVFSEETHDARDGMVARVAFQLRSSGSC